MKVEQKDLGKGELELIVEVQAEELKSAIERAVERISQEVKIEGFRPGKATYEILKQKIGEVAILEEAARIHIGKTLDKIIEENVPRQAIGQPQISITKLAPDNPLEYKVQISLMPEVTLGDYKNLKLKQEKIEVTEEEISKMLGELREMQAKEVISDAPVKDGDKVIVDINMFLDKVPVEGGQAKETAIMIGKGYVVPGFDDKLMGAGKGEEREFQLVYPEEHYQKNLAGKKVDFTVKVKEIYSRELPEVNDQMAEFFGLKNLEALKEDVKHTIEHDKQDRIEQKLEIELMDKLIDNAKFGDIPESVIKNEGEIMMNELQHNVEHQGAKFEDYLSSLKKSREQLMLEMMPDAVKRVKSALLIREIALKENIKADMHEVEHEIQHILTHYPDNKEVEERVQSAEYKNYLLNSLTNRQVIKKLKEWNVEGYKAIDEHENCEHNH